LTRKERVLAAVNHKETDYVPYTIGFTGQAMHKIADHLGNKNFLDKIHSHISMAYYDGRAVEINPGKGYWKDDFGVVWNRNGTDKDIGVVDKYVIEKPSMKGYKFPKIDEEWLRSKLEYLMNFSDDTFKIAGIGYALFERAWTLRGMENILMDMVLEPSFVDELFEAITNFNIEFIDIALEYDIDGFYFGDDWGQQRGMIMGPDYWRRFIKPYMKKMFDKLKSKGKIIAHHSCGDIYEIFPEAIEIGMDIYRTFQPEVYDIRKVKSEFGNDLTFWGGISTQTLLPFGTPDEVRKVVIETIDIMGKNGGFIVAPTHAITHDSPPENSIAFLDVLEQLEKR
jgi:uroporphyrinogen decarboxylase